MSGKNKRKAEDEEPEEDLEVSDEGDEFHEDPKLQKKSKFEEVKKDQTFLEFLENMESYAPIIPDVVTNYYLERAGFNCDDNRIKRAIGLAAQKFIAEITTDALQYSKSRTHHATKDKKSKDRKLVLTMEDLSSALSEYGINANKPEYYT